MEFKSIILIIFSYLNSIEATVNDNYLLLVISLDGFRYDYLDRYSNKNGFLVKFANEGFRALYSESIFPSNTYPNHYTMVTGLTAEDHGILNNEVYDSLTKQRFRMAKDDENSPGWFQNREPVWIKNEKVNRIRNKHSVVFDWPGAPASFGEDKIQPKVWRQIKRENWFLNALNDTVDKFVASVERGKTNLAFLYLGEPDMAGHNYGPESREVEETVKEIDYILDNLFNQLKTRQNYDIDNDLDILIVTDHGMSRILERDETALKKHVFLSDFIDVDKKLLVEACTYGSISELWLRDENDAENVYNGIKSGLENSEKIRGIYLRKDIPERFHIKNHRRSAPIVLLAQPGYQIILTRENSEKYSISKYHGNHGYDVENNEEMRGIFLAKGKSFKTSYKSNKPVYLIDYYSLFCHLLNLTPNNNSGKFPRINHVLVVANDGEDEDLMKTLLTFGIIFIIFLIFVSFIMPSFLIFSSVKMTCDQPPSSINGGDVIKTKDLKYKVQNEKKD